MQGAEVSGSLAVRYSGDLVLVPIADELQSWPADRDALVSAFALLSQAPPAGLEEAPAAPALSPQVFGVVETRNPAPHHGRARALLPHCAVPGVLCNAQGCITHVDGAAAGLLTREGGGEAALCRKRAEHCTEHALARSGKLARCKPDWRAATFL